MTDPFATPASASGIKWEELKGSLLIIEPAGVEENIKTDYGLTNAVRAEVHVLSGALSGETFRDTLIFPKVLQSQVRTRIGQKVLGRLEQGQAKPGQSAPWRLAEANDADRKYAKEWLSTQVVDADKPPF